MKRRSVLRLLPERKILGVADGEKAIGHGWGSNYIRDYACLKVLASTLSGSRIMPRHDHAHTSKWSRSRPSSEHFIPLLKPVSKPLRACSVDHEGEHAHNGLTHPIGDPNH